MCFPFILSLISDYSHTVSVCVSVCLDLCVWVDVAQTTSHYTTGQDTHTNIHAHIGPRGLYLFRSDYFQEPLSLRRVWQETALHLFPLHLTDISNKRKSLCSDLMSLKQNDPDHLFLLVYAKQCEYLNVKDIFKVI